MIEQLATAVAQLARPSIPVDVDLWDMETIGRFLKRDPQVVRERMECLPAFPKAIRLPTMTGNRAGKSQPLYWAKEIIAWAKSHQERH